MPSPNITPDEVVLQPDDYDLPGFTPQWAKAHIQKMKQPVKVTRKQIQFFGERGVPWHEIEKFYNVDRVTLMRYYLTDYEKGVANTNISLRNKMVEVALAGNVTALIWLGKNRLGMGDNGLQEEEHTRKKELTALTTEELRERAKELLK
jgi:hypothetical protein